ncbi:MAG: hypothetical protein QOF78_4327 [Phycisphaerales bacterium]|jgi:peptidoglycan/xylan/chitin deacetylase (PgdA/CDA1 family)|nr:hypothetical protein [Phycisphaerales bacterium]
MTAMPTPSYADYVRRKPSGMRGIARGAALTALATAARLSGRMQQALARPRVQFLLLHHVFDDEVDGFRRLLRELSRDHALIGYGEAVRRITTGQIDRPYLSITFDDGFKDNLRAAQMLAEFGTTGCFFVCPGLVGLADADAVRGVLQSRFDFPIVTPFMDWDDIAQLRAAGHEIGAHTMTHPELAHVPADQMRQEIVHSREALVRRLGAVEHFAWPKGLWPFFSPLARDIVFDAGFASCASGLRGCHVAPHVGSPRDLCIRRDHVFANWPVDHVRYFMMENSRHATAASNGWPAEYARARGAA